MPSFQRRMYWKLLRFENRRLTPSVTDGGRRSGFRRVWRAIVAPTGEFFDDIEGDGDQEDRNDAGGEHAAENGKTKKNPSVRTGSGGDYECDHAKNERERGHQNGTEPHLGCGQCRIGQRLSSLMLDLRKFYDEDRILGGQADQHHQADLSEDVILARLRSHQFEEPQSAEGTEDGNRGAEEHTEGQGPALILRGENQEYKEQGEPENDAGRHALRRDL